MKIWLLRHGMTRLGEEKRYQGSLDEGLSDRGRAQLIRPSLKPERVYVSPALRARETAEILFPAARQLVCDGLREMNFGRFEGRGWWEMEEDADYRAWVEGNCLGPCPGGEDRSGFTARVCSTFDEILYTVTGIREGEEDLILVAHGGTQMALLGERGVPPREYYQWQRPCGCGWLLETDDGGRSLRVLREISFVK